jgi:hypothetical protein
MRIRRGTTMADRDPQGGWCGFSIGLAHAIDKANELTASVLAKQAFWHALKQPALLIQSSKD